MAQLYVRIRGTASPFRLYYRGTTTSIVEALTALDLVWSDATSETIPQGTRAVLNSDLVTTTFDSTLAVWLVVAVKGQPTAPQLIEEKNFLTVQALVGGGNDWAIMYRVTDHLELFQQV